MSSLYLFRLTAVETEQGGLFETQVPRSEFLRDLIMSKPSSEIRQGYVWHIGNVHVVDRDGLFFAAGRTTKTSKEQYDEETGNFLEIEEEESPFTYAIYDSDYSVLGLAAKARLAPTVKGIARSLERLFNSQPSVKDNAIRIEVREIWDPEGFLQQIHEAYAVVGFTVEFGRPNPFDVENDFHKPTQRYLEATGGSRGKTTVQGNDLDRERIEEVTRSVASTGNEAKARLRKGAGQRPVTRHMRGDPVNIPREEVESEEPASILRRIKEAYVRVRRHGGE